MSLDEDLKCAKVATALFRTEGIPMEAYVDLPAGRELDALVASRIFGWTRCETPEGEPVFDYWRRPDSDRGALEEDIPEFSTDIGAAWSVVSKLRDQCEFSLSDDGATWSAGFAGTFDGASARESALSAPLAICRAALAWAESRKP